MSFQNRGFGGSSINMGGATNNTFRSGISQSQSTFGGSATNRFQSGGNRFSSQQNQQQRPFGTNASASTFGKTNSTFGGGSTFQSKTAFSSGASGFSSMSSSHRPGQSAFNNQNQMGSNVGGGMSQGRFGGSGSSFGGGNRGKISNHTNTSGLGNRYSGKKLMEGSQGKQTNVFVQACNAADGYEGFSVFEWRMMDLNFPIGPAPQENQGFSSGVAQSSQRGFGSQSQGFGGQNRFGSSAGGFGAQQKGSWASNSNAGTSFGSSTGNRFGSSMGGGFAGQQSSTGSRFGVGAASGASSFGSSSGFGGNRGIGTGNQVGNNSFQQSSSGIGSSSSFGFNKNTTSRFGQQGFGNQAGGSSSGSGFSSSVGSGGGFGGLKGSNVGGFQRSFGSSSGSSFGAGSASSSASRSGFGSGSSFSTSSGSGFKIGTSTSSFGSSGAVKSFGSSQFGSGSSSSSSFSSGGVRPFANLGSSSATSTSSSVAGNTTTSVVPVKDVSPNGLIRGKFPLTSQASELEQSIRPASSSASVYDSFKILSVVTATKRFAPDKTRSRRLMSNVPREAISKLPTSTTYSFQPNRTDLDTSQSSLPPSPMSTPSSSGKPILMSTRSALRRLPRFVLNTPQEDDTRSRLSEDKENIQLSSVRSPFTPETTAAIPLNLDDAPKTKSLNLDDAPQNKTDILFQKKLNLYTLGEGYSSDPSAKKLANMSDIQLSAVSNFKISNASGSSIEWLEPVDLRDCSLHECVDIGDGEIIVYPNEETKAPEGSGLNHPARLRICGLFPKRKSPDGFSRFEEKLKKWAIDQDAEHKGYETDKGLWIFEVKHFSRYGALDDDEEEEEEDVADDIVDVDLVEEKSRSNDNGYHQESLFLPREAMTAPAGFGYQAPVSQNEWMRYYPVPSWQHLNPIEPSSSVLMNPMEDEDMPMEENIYSNEAIQAFTPYHRILKKPTSLNLFSSDKKASMFPSSAAIPSSSNGTSRAPADGISSPHQTGVSNVGNLRKNVDIVHPILLPLSFALFQEPSLISDSSSRVNVFDDKTQPAPSDLLWSRLSRRDFSSFSVLDDFSFANLSAPDLSFNMEVQDLLSNENFLFASFRPILYHIGNISQVKKNDWTFDDELCLRKYGVLNTLFHGTCPIQGKYSAIGLHVMFGQFGEAAIKCIESGLFTLSVLVASLGQANSNVLDTLRSRRVERSLDEILSSPLDTEQDVEDLVYSLLSDELEAIDIRSNWRYLMLRSAFFSSPSDTKLSQLCEQLPVPQTSSSSPPPWESEEVILLGDAYDNMPYLLDVNRIDVSNFILAFREFSSSDHSQRDSYPYASDFEPIIENANDLQMIAEFYCVHFHCLLERIELLCLNFLRMNKANQEEFEAEFVKLENLLESVLLSLLLWNCTPQSDRDQDPNTLVSITRSCLSLHRAVCVSHSYRVQRYLSIAREAYPYSSCIDSTLASAISFFSKQLSDLLLQDVTYLPSDIAFVMAFSPPRIRVKLVSDMLDSLLVCPDSDMLKSYAISLTDLIAHSNWARPEDALDSIVPRVCSPSEQVWLSAFGVPLAKVAHSKLNLLELNRTSSGWVEPRQRFVRMLLLHLVDDLPSAIRHATLYLCERILFLAHGGIEDASFAPIDGLCLLSFPKLYSSCSRYPILLSFLSDRLHTEVRDAWKFCSEVSSSISSTDVPLKTPALALLAGLIHFCSPDGDKLLSYMYSDVVRSLESWQYSVQHNGIQLSEREKYEHFVQIEVCSLLRGIFIDVIPSSYSLGPNRFLRGSSEHRRHLVSLLSL